MLLVRLALFSSPQNLQNLCPLNFPTDLKNATMRQKITDLARGIATVSFLKALTVEIKKRTVS